MLKRVGWGGGGVGVEHHQLAMLTECEFSECVFWWLLLQLVHDSVTFVGVLEANIWRLMSLGDAI